MLVKFIVCVVAGLGAGIGTGLAGLSAAAVISPMLITFLASRLSSGGHLSASDVLASAPRPIPTAKIGIWTSATAWSCCGGAGIHLIGSWAASLVPNATMAASPCS